MYPSAMKNRQLRKHYIKEWRNYRGYSLRKLADMMESEPGEPITSHANLDRIEKLQQPYTQEIIEALAVALQVEVSDLLNVDPTKEGDVVDLIDAMRNKDKATVLAILQGLPDISSKAN